jgi:hypothetical protein
MRRFLLLFLVALAGTLTAQADECNACPEVKAQWQQLAADGRFSAELVNGDLHEDSPIRLITSSWFLTLPQLPQIFPDLFMIVRARLTDAHGGSLLAVSCDENETVVINVEMQWYVILEGEEVRIFDNFARFRKYPGMRFDPNFPFRGYVPEGSAILTWTGIGVFNIDDVHPYLELLLPHFRYKELEFGPPPGV